FTVFAVDGSRRRAGSAHGPSCSDGNRSLKCLLHMLAASCLSPASPSHLRSRPRTLRATETPRCNGAWPRLGRPQTSILGPCTTKDGRPPSTGTACNRPASGLSRANWRARMTGAASPPLEIVNRSVRRPCVASLFPARPALIASSYGVTNDEGAGASGTTAPAGRHAALEYLAVNHKALNDKRSSPKIRGRLWVPVSRGRASDLEREPAHH